MARTEARDQMLARLLTLTTLDVDRHDKLKHATTAWMASACHGKSNEHSAHDMDKEWLTVHC